MAPTPPDTPDPSRAAAAIGVTVIGRATGRVVHILFLIAVARVLGPAGFGAFAIGWGVARLGALVATLGVEQAALRFGAAHWPDAPDAQRDVLTLTLGVSLAGAAVVTLACVLLGPWLGVRVFEDAAVADVLTTFSAGIPFMALLIVVASLGRLGTRGWHSTLAEDIVQPVVALGAATVIAIASGASATGAVWAVNLSFAAALAYATRFLWVHFARARAAPRARRHALGSFVGFAVVAGLPSRLWVVMTWGDRLLIGHYIDAAGAGVYQAMSQVTMVVPMVLAAVGAAVAPSIAQLSQRDRREELARLFATSTRLGLYVTVPFVLVGLVLPDDLMRAFYGARYTGDAAPLVILFSGQLVNAATGVIGAMLVMTGRAGRWLALSVGMTLLAIALNVALIPRLGLRGAALATTLATVLLNATGLLQARAVSGSWPYDRRILAVVWASLASAGALVAVRALELPAAASVLVGAAASVASFGAVVLLLARDDVRAVLEILRRSRRS